MTHPLFATASILAIIATPVFAQETRTVIDALDREVTVPMSYDRLTILDPLAALEAALSIGLVPTQIGQRAFVAEYLGDPLLQWPWLEAALADLGAEPLRMDATEINLEAVAIGAPDIIVGGWIEGVEDQLSSLAPTIAVPGVDVRTTIALYGQAFGMESEAEAVLAEWDARIEADLRPLTPEGATLALIRTDAPGSISIFNTPGHGAYDYFAQAGYVTPPELASLPVNYYGYGSQISIEQIDLLASADVLVVLGFSVDSTQAMLTAPLFQTLPAVTEDRVVVVPQGPIAQAIAVQSPLNFDVLLELAADVAEAAARAP